MIAEAAKIEAGAPIVTPPPKPTGAKMTVTNLPAGGVQFRKGPGKSFERWTIEGIKAAITNGTQIDAILGPIVTADGFDWLECTYKGEKGAFAINAEPPLRAIIRL